MQKAQKGKLEIFDASQYRLGIVVTQFNYDITEKLLKSALVSAQKYHVPQANISIFRVAGSIEIPLFLKKLGESKKYDCLVALGAIIRGETAHFDYVAKIVSEGVLRIMLDLGIPVGFGILTCDNLKQAEIRVDSGARAIEAALQNAKLMKGLR